MFYYLLYNSSITNFKNSQKKTLTTLLYATFLYILVHAYLNNNSNESIQNLSKYFWLVLTLDIICFIYIYVQQNEEVDVLENMMNLVKNVSSFIGKVLNYSGLNDEDEEEENINDKNDKLIIEELKNKVNQILNKEKDSIVESKIDNNIIEEDNTEIKSVQNNKNNKEDNSNTPKSNTPKSNTPKSNTPKSTPLHILRNRKNNSNNINNSNNSDNQLQNSMRDLNIFNTTTNNQLDSNNLQEDVISDLQQIDLQSLTLNKNSADEKLNQNNNQIIKKSTSLKDLRKKKHNNAKMENNQRLNDQLNQLPKILPNESPKLNIENQRLNINIKDNNILNDDFINRSSSDDGSVMDGSESGSEIDFDINDFENNM